MSEGLYLRKKKRNLLYRRYCYCWQIQSDFTVRSVCIPCQLLPRNVIFIRLFSAWLRKLWETVIETETFNTWVEKAGRAQWPDQSPHLTTRAFFTKINLKDEASSFVPQVISDLKGAHRHLAVSTTENSTSIAVPKHCNHNLVFLRQNESLLRGFCCNWKDCAWSFDTHPGSIKSTSALLKWMFQSDTFLEHPVKCTTELLNFKNLLST